MGHVSYIGKKVRVIQCSAFGAKFKNLTPDSVHVIVAPPALEMLKNPNGSRGFWVMGVGEPVLLLFSEIEEVIQ